MSGHQSWFPSKVHINTGCLCSAGSSLPGRSPTSKLICSPPTPCPHWPPLRFPLLWPTSMLTLVLCQKGRRHVCPHTCRASETGHRLSAIPGFVEERRGPPRLRGHPLRACYGRTPRRISSPPRPKKNSRRGLLLPSMKSSTLGIRKDYRFRGRSPTARTFACLRFAELDFQERRKACYRLGRAHPWPGRIPTCWTTNKVSWWHRVLQFPLTHRAWSYYFIY